jgi:hypothetical protein
MNIQHLRTLEQAATEGPWVAKTNPYLYDAVSNVMGPGKCSPTSVASMLTVENAALIEAVRNVLPLLLDVAEAALAFTTDDYTWDREAKGDPGPALTAALARLDALS